MQTSDLSEKTEFLRELLAGLGNERLSEVLNEIEGIRKTSRKKREDKQAIYTKKPSLVHLTVHCTHCNQHYTVIKRIHDNDLIYYSTTKEGKVAKTKLIAQGETWVDTYTQWCNNCERYINSLSIEELRRKYIENTLKRRRF